MSNKPRPQQYQEKRGFSFLSRRDFLIIFWVAENGRLKQLVGDLSLDNAILKEAAGGN
ncbi:MAG: hypothetical protein ABSG21_09315 [Spirochaetia bacterium]|jgi:hypothetical protein